MKIVHNVQIYPVIAGHINDNKIIGEEEFNSREDALTWVGFYNQHEHWNQKDWLENGNGFKAVYTGAIDTETGENL